MWKSKQFRPTLRNSNSVASCIHTDQVNLVSIIHLSLIKKRTDQNKTAACYCGNSVQYYFHAHDFHSPIVLGMQRRNFQKTVVWTLIVLNCWKILVKYFVPTLQQFQVLNLLVDPLIHLNICTAWYKVWNKVGQPSEVQTALFVVSIKHFRSLKNPTDCN